MSADPSGGVEQADELPPAFRGTGKLTLRNIRGRNVQVSQGVTGPRSSMIEM